MRLPLRLGAVLLAGAACSDGPTNPRGGPAQLSVLQLIGDNTITDFVSVGSTTYAVGEYGLVMRTEDGISWTTAATGSEQFFLAIAHSGSRFLAVGGGVIDFVGGRVLTSSDGSAWQEREIPVLHTLFDVAWAGAQFVAVGASGVIATSPDGISWTVRNEQQGVLIRGVAWSGSRVVAVAHDGVNYFVLSSPDGNAWTLDRTGSGALVAVQWTGNEFVATGSTVLRSANGVDWTETSTPAQGFLLDIAHAEGVYVGIGTDGTFFSSPDASDWTERSVLGAAGKAVVWTGSLFLAAGTEGAVSSSPDGSTWTRRYPPPAVNLRAVARSSSHLVAVGRRGHVVTSEDGRTWTSRPTPVTEMLTDVAWSGTQFVAVTDGFDGVNQVGAKALRSSDGISWTVHSVGEPGILNAIAWSAPLGKYVATGRLGVLHSSADGIAWMQETSGTDADLADVIWAGSHFLVAGGASFLLRSTAGGWEPIHPSTDILAYVRLAQSPQAIVAVATELMQVGPVRTYTASASVDWAQTSAAGPIVPQALAWTGTQFVRLWRGGAQRSADGYAWSEFVVEQQFPRRVFDLRDAVQSGQELIVVGDRGTLWVIYRRT